MTTTHAVFHPTVARLTWRALLGKRRAWILAALPALLLLISVLVQSQTGSDDRAAVDLLSGFALAAMVPLIGVIAGTGAIAPEIDDGSVVYLLAKPVRRSTIILTKFAVAAGVTLGFTLVPVWLAGMILNGNSQQLATAFTVATAVAAVCYSAIFLLLGVISRNAVVFGLVYALVWEALLGRLMPGAQNLSVQQWALAFAEAVADSGARLSSAVSLGGAAVLMVLAVVAALWYASRRLSAFTLAGEG